MGKEERAIRGPIPKGNHLWRSRGEVGGIYPRAREPLLWHECFSNEGGREKCGF